MLGSWWHARTRKMCRTGPVFRFRQMGMGGEDPPRKIRPYGLYFSWWGEGELPKTRTTPVWVWFSSLAGWQMGGDEPNTQNMPHGMLWVVLRYAPIRLNFLVFVSLFLCLVSYICMTSCYDVFVLFLFLAMISSITNTYIIMPSSWYHHDIIIVSSYVICLRTTTHIFVYVYFGHSI